MRTLSEVANSAVTSGALALNRDGRGWSMHQVHKAVAKSEGHSSLGQSLIEHGPICLAAVPRKFIYGHRHCLHGRPSRQDWQRQEDKRVRAATEFIIRII